MALLNIFLHFGMDKISLSQFQRPFCKEERASSATAGSAPQQNLHPNLKSKVQDLRHQEAQNDTIF
jgi:hypothetical protein